MNYAEIAAVLDAQGDIIADIDSHADDSNKNHL